MENGTDMRCYAFHWAYTREDTGGEIGEEELSSEDACVFGHAFYECVHNAESPNPFLEPFCEDIRPRYHNRFSPCFPNVHVLTMQTVIGKDLVEMRYQTTSRRLQIF